MAGIRGVRQFVEIEEKAKNMRKNKHIKMKNDKLVILKLNPPLWIEDYGADDATFEYKKNTSGRAKDAYCITEVKVPLSEIIKKVGAMELSNLIVEILSNKKEQL